MVKRLVNLRRRKLPIYINMRKNILSSKIVKDEIQKAREDEWRVYNSDWSGMQEGF